MIPGETIQLAAYPLQNRNTLIYTFIVLLTFITIAVDFCEACFHHSSFYISESLLFSSFWVLSFPLLKVQLCFADCKRSISKQLLLTVLLILVHLISFPALVWFLSYLLYYHTFSYRQTLEFGITTHFIKIILLYTIPLFVFYVWQQKESKPAAIAMESIESSVTALSTLIVSESNNRKLPIKTEDVSYFSSASPYVHIHHIHKKYLHSETLKSLLSQLDPEKFIRIHKSCVVNILFVVSYQSRLNGDYDLTLKDGTELRLSRNYAAAFKSSFEKSHRLTL